MRTHSSHHTIAAWLLSTLMLTLLAACTNNGNIGPLFGTWVLTDCSCDGSPVTFADGNVVSWSFQNHIIAIDNNDLNTHITTSYFGTWTRTDNTLTLNYTHHDNQYPAGSSIYSAPPFLGMDSNTEINCLILNADNRNMTLRYTNSAGNTWTYTLKKTW